MLKGDGRPLLRTQGLRVEQQRLVRDGQPVAGARNPEPHEIAQVLGHAVPPVALIRGDEVVFQPRPIKQGDEPVLEDVQEVT